MKAVYLVFLGIILGLNSCMWGEDKKPKPDITTDTLTYIYKTIKQRAADCGNKPDSECTVVNIKYPVFKNQTILNDTVAKIPLGCTTAEILVINQLQHWINWLQILLAAIKMIIPKNIVPVCFTRSI